MGWLEADVLLMLHLNVLFEALKGHKDDREIV